MISNVRCLKEYEMPYLNRPEILTPPDAASVWRYFKSRYFLNALATGALHFSPISRFARDDPWEAAIPKSGLEWRRQLPIKARDKGKAELERAVENVLKMEGFRQQSAKAVKANCWHISLTESEAMWKLFVGQENGVAIRSSVGNIKSALAAASEQVFVGEIRYVNYNDAEFNDVQWHDYCFHKREAFSHEKEMRLAFFDVEEFMTQAGEAKGASVKVNMQELILEVRVKADRSEVMDDIKSALASASIGIEPTPTELAMPPISALSLFTFAKKGI